MPESSVRPRRIVVGVSGASGAALGLECLKCLRQAGAESALVVTRGGEITIEQELGMTLDEFAAHADVVYDNKNIGAAIASGTYPVAGMIVAPCSMKTLAGIASGYSENLLLRAADVQMKEQRRLVLMVRETPFSAIHVDNMRAWRACRASCSCRPCSRFTTAPPRSTMQCITSPPRRSKLLVCRAKTISAGHRHL